jgi:uncharacterized oxidoreductase
MSAAWKRSRSKQEPQHRLLERSPSLNQPPKKWSVEDAGDPSPAGSGSRDHEPKRLASPAPILPSSIYKRDSIMQLTDNVIFITGGGSGIGRGLAQAFHKLGNQVIIAGRRAALLDEVTRANPGMASVVLDVNDPANIAAVAARTIVQFPKLNVLINNAGVMSFENVASAIDDGAAQALVTTNLLGPIRVTSVLIEHLKAQPRAAIVYNSSALAFAPLAPAAVYSATKAAIHSFALSQRFMLRNSSVTVQEIAPPWVETDLIEARGGMPLAAFISDTMALLATDVEEIVVGDAHTLRNNAGPKEHAFVNGFNAQMAQAFGG